jgi:type VI secretion system protein ImpM
MSEATLSHGEPPGWFGKLPGLGDFASRRLPPPFVRGCDEWLQDMLAAARDALGTAWFDEHYLHAPPWRFWIGPGLLGSRCWAGLLAPSVDRVGRQFAFIVAEATARPPHGLATALAARAWFGAIEALQRRLLGDHLDSDGVERAFAAVAPLARDAAADEAQQLAHELLRPFPSRAPCSIWWRGGAAEAAQFYSFGSMPPAAAFIEFIGGEAAP